MLRTPWPQPVLLYPPYLSTYEKHIEESVHLVQCICRKTYPECLSKQKMTFLDGSRLHHSLPWSAEDTK